MIINRNSLLNYRPVRPFLKEKLRYKGVSYGLAEAGYDIRINQDIWLHPFNKFKLASSCEYFRMPDNLVGIVHDKSTWARKGLSVFNTVIEPGWEGYLTLELVYHGWKPIHIKRGMGIAQVIFHKTSDKAQYNGKYQNQPNKPVGAIFEGL